MDILASPSLLPSLETSFPAVFGIWALILRIWVGSVLVLYALRASFGFFPNTGMPVQTVAGTAAYMEKFGWKPGLFWAWLSTVNNLVGGALLALGLFTRPVALTCALLLFLSAVHHIKDGFFSNQNGFEHYALWGFCALFFVFYGGGPYALDALLALTF
ncbi:DoxX family protein [Celeribacter indicus]|uniref:Membrane DoxD-like family protein n=1 Tax=Celeribacter indicus TaxID=1208324 RepID=A0A0B5DUN4_9RHOB|nr:DoxX family protein [Celeribacter indicus]AJE44940.1 membrane DoxD-like family protein [Celeribacter indicus]SDW96764.1 putative oxidoreductase [Celeribacter indicus]